MRKFWVYFAALLLMLGLSGNVSAAEEQSHTDGHCVCGRAAVGVGDHTVCADMAWQPLSKALEAAGLTMSTANFGMLPSGSYYLDGDVIVTASSSLGAKSDSLKTTPDRTVELSVCLNGYSITRAKDSGRIFGYLHMGSVLNICDCSYSDGVFRGSIAGGSQNNGSVIYTYSDSSLNIYGGNISGKAYTNGGTIAVANDGCGDVDGNNSYNETDRNLAAPSTLNLYNGSVSGSTVTGSGGTLLAFHRANINIYGGTVTGGTAQVGGCIYVSKGSLQITGGELQGGTAQSGGLLYVTSGETYITGGTVTGGVCSAGTEVVQVIRSDGKLLGTYTTFAEGLAKAQDASDCYLRLINDLETTDTVSGTLYLDLNGHTLRGITITGTVYGMDCTTNSYDDSAAGSLIPAAGAPQRLVKTTAAQTGAIRRYLALETDGSYSFHRFYLGITKVTLKPSTCGFGYKATFAGGERVAAALKQSQGFGYKLWISEELTVSRGYGAAQFGGIRELTLRIDNFLDPNATAAENAERAELDVHAAAFLCLADGTQITSTEVCCDLRQMVELADAAYGNYTAAQQNALSGLSARFSEAMLSWDIENTHHADGSVWQSVDLETLTGKLTLDSANYNRYRLAGGSYVLTEDIDLGTKRLRVNSGVTVNICLNGHTLTSANRVFDTWGTLNICDCHASGEEGTVLGTLTGETDQYAPVAYCRYGSLTNLYGGNLMANGKVSSAGVIALSHDGSTANTEKPSAVMNMYGGSISGGSVCNNGGLISIWNGASFYMYGGALYGGSADSRGGGIDVSNGTAEIYGGRIYGNTASTGGGIAVTGSNAGLAIAGGRIYGNTAGELGDGIFLNKAQAVLSGDPQITDNAVSNLYMDFYSTLQTDGLTEGAHVGLTAEAVTVLGTNLQDGSYIACDSGDYVIREAYGELRVMPNDLAPASSVSGFQVGFGETCITPETIEGIPLAGFSNPTERLATAQEPEPYDELMAQSVAITDGDGQTVILIFCDLITCDSGFFDYVVDAVAAATGVPETNIFINCSHSHSVPSLSTTSVPAQVAYNRTLPNLFARSALLAMHDRQSATMETGSFEVSALINGEEKFLNFFRHYSYEEDGIVKYFGDQFGTATYNASTEHVRDADHTMHLVRFVRDGKDILMSNWRIHPHRTGGETKYQLSADVIGTLRYYMGQMMPDTHFVYFQGAAGNVNSVSRLSKYNHGLDYVAYGQVLASCIVDNLGCLESEAVGKLQVDNYEYLATADVPDDELYTKAKAVYDIYVVETAGMSLGEKNKWVLNYCAENPEYDFISGFQLSFIVNRRKNQKDTLLPLNVVTLGNSFGFFTAPGEMWDAVSVAVEEASPIKTVFCLGYSMAHYHYFVYYPDSTDQENGVPYASYESENRHFLAPQTIQDMIKYWSETMQEMYNS